MKRFVFLVMAVAGSFANCGAAAAAVQAQSDVPGIGSGLPIESASFSMVNYYGSTSTSGPRAQVDDISIKRQLDSSSPQLANAALMGKPFKEVEIHFCETSCGSATPYMTYKLRNVQITSYQLGSMSDPIPTEDITMNYQKMTMTYFPTPMPPRTAWGAILPPGLPAGGVEPYRFDFMLNAATTEALFNRPLSPLGDGLPATLFHVNVPEPATIWLIVSSLFVAVANGRRRRFML